MSNDKFDIYIEKFKDRFDQSIDTIDGETASRITRVRFNALERAGKRTGAWLWLPSGAVAAACLGLVIYSLLPREPVDDGSFIDEVEIISELDLYEDLEFYEWLELHELPS
jgi:hypothetical protein